MLLAACFQKTPVDPERGMAASPTREIIPLGRSGSHSILFQGVLFRIPSGTVLGEVRIGNRITDEMRWTRAKSQTTEFNVAITDRLRERGYQMKDASDAIFHPRRAVKTRYEMAAVLHRVELDFEYERSARAPTTIMQNGDRIRMYTGGGGGHGDPLERPAADVAEEVRAGYITAEQARDDYGVVMTADGNALDIEQTDALRVASTV